MTNPLTPPPMTEWQIMAAIRAIGKDAYGRVALTYESGPYDIDKPTIVATRLCEAVAGTINAQWQARVAELERDAARYRWLRHGDNDEKVIQRGPVANDYVYLPRNAKLDEMIDAALSSEGKGAEG